MFCNPYIKTSGYTSGTLQSGVSSLYKICDNRFIISGWPTNLVLADIINSTAVKMLLELRRVYSVSLALKTCLNYRKHRTSLRVLCLVLFSNRVNFSNITFLALHSFQPA